MRLKSLMKSCVYLVIQYILLGGDAIVTTADSSALIYNDEYRGISKHKQVEVLSYAHVTALVSIQNNITWSNFAFSIIPCSCSSELNHCIQAHKKVHSNAQNEVFKAMNIIILASITLLAVKALIYMTKMRAQLVNARKAPLYDICIDMSYAADDMSHTTYIAHLQNLISIQSSKL